VLPDPALDSRSDSTALAVAVGGVMCPVPFLMSAAALKIAGDPRRSRRAAVAYGLSVATIIGQVLLVAWIAYHLLR
jgi:hypothetical protein